MKWLASGSEWLFRGLNFAESVVSLPKPIVESLRFREEWETHLTHDASAPTLWVHGASVGELEDLANFFVDPEIFSLSGYRIENLVVTSSSPSARGFLSKLRAKFPLLYAGPIPTEDSGEIRRFLKRLRPELLVLSHSDLWPNLMQLAQSEALARGIVWMPTKSSSAKVLFENLVLPSKLRAIGVRASDDVAAFRERFINYPDTEFPWIGNPRLDRIATRITAQRLKGEHVLEESRALPDTAKLSILLGSVWPEDAAVLADALKGLDPAMQERIQLVAIPHVTDDMHVVASIQHLLPMARVLRVQGILLEAYQNFDVAFIGGGYRTGLHSVLEPALWGLPIICGPQLRKQPEASSLQASGVLHAMNTPSELRSLLERLTTEPSHLSDQKQAAALVAEQMKASTGASKRLSHLVSTFRVNHHV